MRRTCDRYPWPRRSRLLGRIRKAATLGELRRWQVILLAASGIPYRSIADLAGVSIQAVKLWVSQYRRRGSEGLRRKGRGGRRTGLLTVEQEKDVIKDYLQRIDGAHVNRARLVIKIIRELCSKKAGRWYVYKLLERHGLRKHRPKIV
ncbi:MAG: hypothetical protein A2X48_14740 [Lentisphaerae bacterium GWF2_49_21]|nr:MAG: hypothetical protein A2X48_14740 [Lentisphaerae bacterium GWF2_49_21]